MHDVALFVWICYDIGMNKDMAIYKAFLGFLLAFTLPVMVFGATPRVDNVKGVTIEQLQQQVIRLLLMQIHMLEEQLDKVEEQTDITPDPDSIPEIDEPEVDEETTDGTQETPEPVDVVEPSDVISA